MNTTKITIQATVNVSPEKAWDLYTNPVHITGWNFASNDWHCPRAENDMRVGGKYSSRMEAKDGSWGFDFEAIYDKVVAPETFTYTIADGRKVKADFAENGNSTQVTITFDAENENPVEMQKAGWQSILDNYKKYAEAN